MEEILMSRRLRKIVVKYKPRLEQKLKVQIEIKPARIFVEGEAYDEYIASKVFEAIDLGFNLNAALSLASHDYMLEKINLKKYVRPSRLRQVKGRIIGEKGRARELISELSECEIVVKDNIVALIGDVEFLPSAKMAVLSLIRGSPHSSVYSLLEKQRRKMREARDINFQ